MMTTAPNLVIAPKKRAVARTLRRRHTPTYLLIRTTVRIVLAGSIVWMAIVLWVPGVPR